MEISRMSDGYTSAMYAIGYEAHQAAHKFPAFNSAHEGYAVLLEEVDELWDEVKRHDVDFDAMIGEAIQVGAMALRFVADMRAKLR